MPVSWKKLMLLTVLGVSSLRCLWSLLPALFLGGLFACLLFPWVQGLRSRGWSRSASAALLTSLLSLLFFFPIVLFMILGARALLWQWQVGSLDGWLKQAPQALQAWLHESFWGQRVQGVLSLMAFRDQEWVEWLHDALASLGSVFAEWAGGWLAQLPTFALNFSMVVASLFVCLVYGDQFAPWFRASGWLPEDQADRWLNHLGRASRAVLVASLASGGLQALLTGVLSISLGLSYAVWAVAAVFLCSFVPIVGALPAALAIFFHQWFFGEIGFSTGLLLQGVLLLGVDSLIRLWILKHHANLPPFLALIAAIGGLEAWGPVGLFLGPIVLCAFLQLWSLGSEVLVPLPSQKEVS